MTIRKINYQYSVIFQLCSLYDPDCLFFSFLSESFSALIKSCKISGKPCCFFLCFCIEKCKRTGSCIQSATGIDTWSQHKSDMISCDFSIFQRICSDQFLQSLIFGIFQTAQPFFYQNPVLSLKIHNISYCCNSRQFIIIFQLLCRNAKSLVKCCNIFKGHHCPTQVFIRVWTIILFRIQNRICRRKHHLAFSLFLPVRNLMMICNNHCHSLILCHLDFSSRSNSIITGHDRIDPVRFRSFYKMCMNPISVCNSVRNISIHICSDPRKAFH